MAAFGFQRVAAAVAQDQATDTQARTRPDHRVVARLAGLARDPGGTADLDHVIGLQQRNRHRLCGEVVDQVQLVETEHGGGAAARDHPRMVGDARFVTVDATGHREHAAAGGGTDLFQMVARGVTQRRELGHRVLADAVLLQWCILRGVGQGEAGVGAADVGDQHRLRAGTHAEAPLSGASTPCGRNSPALLGPHWPAG